MKKIYYYIIIIIYKKKRNHTTSPLPSHHNNREVDNREVYTLLCYRLVKRQILAHVDTISSKWTR